MFDWVDPAYAEQVVHQRASTRTAGCDSNIHVANHLGDVGYGQEVGRKFELVDGYQFLTESPLHLGEHGFASPRIAPVHAGFSLMPEHLERVAFDAEGRFFGGLRLHPAAVADGF